MSAKTVFRPGHKANPALEGQTSGGGYGAGLTFEPAPAAAVVNTSRRQFGSYSLPAEEPSYASYDSLGPVDLQMERSLPPPKSKKKAEEPPPDTLRWDPSAQGGGRGGLAATARRKAAIAAEEAAAATARAMQQQQPHQGASRLPRPEQRELTEPPNRRERTEAGLRYEEQMRARAVVEAERAEQEQRAAAVKAAAMARGGQPLYYNKLLADESKVAAMSDPRVQAALQAKLNEPNTLAAQQYKSRNTTRVSSERKY